MTLFNDKDSKSSQNIRNNCCVRGTRSYQNKEKSSQTESVHKIISVDQ